MGPKEGRRVRKIEVPTDTPTELDLGDTAAGIEKQREETTHSAEEGMAEKHPRTDKSDTEMDTEGGGEAGTSQSQSRHKKGHITNIYLTDSDEEAIVDFVYDNTNEHFKDTARVEFLWERFANSCKLSIKVCKTWFKSCKLSQSKSGQAPYK